MKPIKIKDDDKQDVQHLKRQFNWWQQRVNDVPGTFGEKMKQAPKEPVKISENGDIK